MRRKVFKRKAIAKRKVFCIEPLQFLFLSNKNQQNSYFARILRIKERRKKLDVNWERKQIKTNALLLKTVIFCYDLKSMIPDSESYYFDLYLCTKCYFVTLLLYMIILILNNLLLSANFLLRSVIMHYWVNFMLTVVMVGIEGVDKKALQSED